MPGAWLIKHSLATYEKNPTLTEERERERESKFGAGFLEATRPRPEEAEPAEAPSVGLDWEMEAAS